MIQTPHMRRQLRPRAVLYSMCGQSIVNSFAYHSKVRENVYSKYL